MDAPIATVGSDGAAAMADAAGAVRDAATVDASRARDAPSVKACAGSTMPNSLPDGTWLPVKLPAGTAAYIGGLTNETGISALRMDLDNVRLYDRALTPIEVGSHFAKAYEPCTRAGGCLAEYTFDAIRDGAFADTAGALPAKILGTVTTIPGVISQAAHFDGGGWLRIGPDPALTISSAFTFDAWLYWDGVWPPNPSKPNDRLPFERVFVMGSPGALDLHFHIGPHIGMDLTSGVFYYDFFAKKGWQHIVVTFDNKSGVYFYNNGKLICATPHP